MSNPNEPIDGSPEPSEPVPAESVADAPVINMDTVSAATAVHDEAVTKAHNDLATRMAAAYAEFHNALDRARQLWEDSYQAAKSAAGIVTEMEHGNVGEQDPTRAR